MPEEPIQTSPPTQNPIPTSQSDSQLLRDKFDEETAAQAARMDDLAKQLITLELAIPGLYATALKLLQGDKAVVTFGKPLCFTFILWLAALICSIAAIYPRRYKVNLDVIRYQNPPTDPNAPLSIEGYFNATARYKLNWLSAAIICFFAGIAAALWSLT